MAVIFWGFVGFISGAIPFSLITGRLAARLDIREVGDQNPGAWNVMRAAGWRWGAVALLLDYLKGAIPVGYAFFYLGMTGWEIVPVAISPILGHAFSPFLKFNGGKAVATTFGVWSGLTIGTGPILLGALLGLFYILLDSSGWSVMITLVLFGSFVINYYTSAPEFIWIWLGNLIVVFWKHHSELRKFPGIRPEIHRVFRRRK